MVNKREKVSKKLLKVENLDLDLVFEPDTSSWEEDRYYLNKLGKVNSYEGSQESLSNLSLIGGEK